MNKENLQVSDKMHFGKYLWRVLEVQNDRVLVITEEIILKRPYHNGDKDTTWADCELRNYLNGEFYNSFEDHDKLRILQVTNKNPDNQWYGTNGGKDTEDYIFLLTIEDVVCKYFGDSSEILNNSIYKQKKYKYWFGTKDKNNIYRVANHINGGVWWWWLRSPGRINRTACYIHGVPAGIVGINGNGVYFKHFGTERDGGVRPALWLKI